MRESIFCSAIVKSLRECGAWAFKVPDQPTSWTSHLTRFTAEKPFDIVSFFHGGIAIECKMIKKFQAFNMRFMRHSQIKNLSEVIAAGDKAFVFLNIRLPAKKGVQKREDRLIIFEWAQFRATPVNLLRKKNIEQMSYIAGRDGFYDLSGWINGIVGRA